MGKPKEWIRISVFFLPATLSIFDTGDMGNPKELIGYPVLLYLITVFSQISSLVCQSATLSIFDTGVIESRVSQRNGPDIRFGSTVYLVPSDIRLGVSICNAFHI